MGYIYTINGSGTVYLFTDNSFSDSLGLKAISVLLFISSSVIF